MTARGKGKEISLQVEIESQEDWEENLAKEGLLVIDVYQEWCGPCKAMVPIFKRIKNESGDELLRFAIAKADTVEALDRYRGKCEPKFLFYAGGLLVEVVHGADSPALGRSIVQQLENEKKVAEGSANRKEIIDQKFPTSKRTSVKEAAISAFEDEESSIGSSDEEAMEERRSDSHMRFGGEHIVLSDIDAEMQDTVLIEKECCILIIYPDILADGKLKDILIKIRASKFEILDELERILTEDEILSVFGNRSDEFLKMMQSGPSYVCLITKGEYGERIFALVQEAIGPKGVFMGNKDVAPNSLRGNFLRNEAEFEGFYSSESNADAKREIPTFFPTYVTKKVSLTNLHHRNELITVVLIRPKILDRLSAIMDTISTLDFKVVTKKEKKFTEEEINEYFRHEYPDDNAYKELLEIMTGGASLILVLSNGKDSVVDDWLAQLGPKEPAVAFMQAPNSFRGRFGNREALISNFESSTSIDLAEKEFFRYFPTSQTLLLVKPDAFDHKDEIMMAVRKRGFFVSGRKDIQLSKDQTEDIFKGKSQMEYYPQLVEYMCSGLSCAMILSKYEAIEEMYEWIHGPEIQEDANKYNPVDKETTLRDIYGTDIMKNALMSSKTKEEAKAQIQIFWGDVAFEDDGTMKKIKKVKRETVCEAKGKMTTKEEVYEEIAQLPPKIKQSDIDEEEERRKQQQKLLDEEAKQKLILEDLEAKQIAEAKFITEDMRKWGAEVEAPPPAKTICAPCPIPLEVPPPLSFQFEANNRRDLVARAPTPDRISLTEVQLKESSTDLFMSQPEEDQSDACIVDQRCSEPPYLFEPSLWNWYEESLPKQPKKIRLKESEDKPYLHQPYIHNLIESSQTEAPYLHQPHVYNWYDGNNATDGPYICEPLIHNWFEKVDSPTGSLQQPYLHEPYIHHGVENKNMNNINVNNNNLSKNNNLEFISDEEPTEKEEPTENEGIKDNNLQDEEATDEQESEISLKAESKSGSRVASRAESKQASRSDSKASHQSNQENKTTSRPQSKASIKSKVSTKSTVDPTVANEEKLSDNADNSKTIKTTNNKVTASEAVNENKSKSEDTKNDTAIKKQAVKPTIKKETVKSADTKNKAKKEDTKPQVVEKKDSSKNTNDVQPKEEKDNLDEPDKKKNLEQEIPLDSSNSINKQEKKVPVTKKDSDIKNESKLSDSRETAKGVDTKKDDKSKQKSTQKEKVTTDNAKKSTKETSKPPTIVKKNDGKKNALPDATNEPKEDAIEPLKEANDAGRSSKIGDSKDEVLDDSKVVNESDEKNNVANSGSPKKEKTTPDENTKSSNQAAVETDKNVASGDKNTSNGDNKKPENLSTNKNEEKDENTDSEPVTTDKVNSIRQNQDENINEVEQDTKEEVEHDS